MQTLAVCTKVPNLCELSPETELFKYDQCIVTIRILNEENIHENGEDVVIAMKGKPKRFVISSSSQFYMDVLKRYG